MHVYKHNRRMNLHSHVLESRIYKSNKTILPPAAAADKTKLEYLVCGYVHNLVVREGF